MITPSESVTKSLLLRELNLLKHVPGKFICEKVSDLEVCVKCAQPSSSVYDRRWVRVRDLPLRSKDVELRILKRRFWCKTCQRPFTEPIRGILPRRRTTQRFREAVLEACEKYRDLTQVRGDFRVSSDFIYRIYFEQLELKRRMNCQYEWPRHIGIDEHGFGKNPTTHVKAFASLIVNHNRKKVMEVVQGKSQHELETALSHIPGRENVRFATIDMCDPFKNYISKNFPNAQIVADKFHVLRLLSPVIMKKRREIAGTNATRKARSYLLRSSKHLDYLQRRALNQYLEKEPILNELYEWKESLHSFYRIKHPRAAANALDSMIIGMSLSKLKEIKRLRNTLLKWKKEILNYFISRLTNARLEGFNCKASLIRRSSYGLRNFNHYRLRILSACG